MLRTVGQPFHLKFYTFLKHRRYLDFGFSCAHIISTSIIIITIVVKLVGSICAYGTSALITRRGTLQAMFAAGWQVHLALEQSDG